MPWFPHYRAETRGYEVIYLTLQNHHHWWAAYIRPNTHTHTQKRGSVLPGNSADTICSELIYAKPIPFPSDVVFIAATSNVSCPWVSPLPANLHTHPMIMFIHINTKVYVSYLQTDSLNEEGEQRPCWLMEYS